jgi:hypothetical protein
MSDTKEQKIMEEGEGDFDYPDEDSSSSSEAVEENMEVPPVELDSEGEDETVSSKRRRVEVSDHDPIPVQSPTSTSTSTSLVRNGNIFVSPSVNQSVSVPVPDALDFAELTITGLGDKSYSELTNGAKLLVRLQTLSLDSALAFQLVNLLAQIRSSGANPRSLQTSIALFGYPRLSQEDLNDFQLFDNQIPDNFSSSVLSDPKLDRIVMSRSNFVSILRQLSRYVNGSRLLSDENFEITFKSLKPITISKILFETEEGLRSLDPPLVDKDRDQLTKFFTGLVFTADQPFISMFHEFSGMFPHEVDKKTGVSHNVQFRTSPPFTYVENNMNQFLDQVSSQLRPTLPHLQVSRALASCLSTYKLGMWFACAPGDLYFGQYFFAQKLNRALNICDPAVRDSFVKAALTFRTTAFKNLTSKDAKFKMSDDVVAKMKLELEQACSVLSVKSKRTFGNVMLDFMKGSYYFLQSFKIKWEFFSSVIKREDGKLIPATVSKFLKMITSTDSKIDQMSHITRYMTVLSNLSKIQDILTPLNDNFASGKSHLVNSSIKLAVKKVAETIMAGSARNPVVRALGEDPNLLNKYRNPDDGGYQAILVGNKSESRVVQPILISHKGPFQGHLDNREVFDIFRNFSLRFSDAGKGIVKFLFTSGKPSHSDDLFSFDLPPFIAALTAAVNTMRLRNEEPNVIIVLKKINNRFLRSIFHLCGVLGVVNYTIIGTIQEIIGGEEPLIYTSEDKKHAFPSIMTAKLVGSYDKDFLPIVSFGLVKTAPLDDGKDRSGIMKGMGLTYSRLAWHNAFVFSGAVHSIGSLKNGTKMSSDLVFNYLESILGKIKDSEISATFADVVNLPQELDPYDDKEFLYDE